MSKNSRTVRRRREDEEVAPPDGSSDPTDAASPRSWRRDPTPTVAQRPVHEPLVLDDLAQLADMDPSELAAMMEGTVVRRRVEIGEKVTGTVSRVERETVFVDIGAKAEATLARGEAPEAEVGDTLEAFVIADDEGGISLSVRLSGDAAGAFLEEAVESGMPVEGKVVSRNPGGFEVRVGAVRAFCPMSHIDRFSPADPEAFVGQTLAFRVLETGEKVVLSRRRLLEDALVGEVEKFWTERVEGDLLEGVVTSIHPWGVFVDLGGVDGLLHQRDLGWEGSGDTGVFARGQRVDVRIKSLDHGTRKVGLSLKDPTADPWNLVGVEFLPGATYSGRVRGIEAYGAFIELTPGLRGLLHVSRLDNARAATLAVGDDLEVRLVSVDHERRRLELDLAEGGGGRTQPTSTRDDQVGATVGGVVDDVLRNGVVVTLDDGRVGWLGARDIELPPGTVLAQRFRKGRPITARISKDGPSQVTLTQRSETEAETAREWAAHQRAEPAASTSGFGTLGDLFKKSGR